MLDSVKNEVYGELLLAQQMELRAVTNFSRSDLQQLLRWRDGGADQCVCG
ncbi:hypothetical protein WDS16_03425 [Rhodococcus sovatensis]|uniref:Uncharacterized protein n=1 Tax=Rhodococcus sovatensis TaxID=1805840 RepID=A0ABZ2PUC2_9NOCA